MKYYKELKIFLPISFLFFFSFDAESQNRTDTIQLSIEWNGLKKVENINGDSFTTFEVGSALYFSENNYLPVIETKDRC